MIIAELWTDLIEGYCDQEADDLATVMHIKATEQHKRLGEYEKYQVNYNSQAICEDLMDSAINA